MMEYILINRKKSKIAKNNREFINWMKKCDFQKWDTLEEFMEGYSHRKLLFEKIIIDSSSIDKFVDDLQKNNILKIEKRKINLFSFLGLTSQKSDLKFRSYTNVL